MSSARSASKRTRTPATVQPSSIRTRSMGSGLLDRARRGSLPGGGPKARRALDLKTMNGRFEDEDEDDEECGGEPSGGATAVDSDGGRPAKFSRRDEGGAKGKGRADRFQLPSGLSLTREDPDEQARFLAPPSHSTTHPPFSPRSDERVVQPTSPRSDLPSPFYAQTSSSNLSRPLPRSPRPPVVASSSPMRGDDSLMEDASATAPASDEEEDDLLLLTATPRRLGASRPVVAGRKRSRDEAFAKAEQPIHLPLIPPAPIVDQSNPFYIAPASVPSLPKIVLPPASSPSSIFASGIDALSIESSTPGRKRVREILAKRSPEDVPKKSCLSTPTQSPAHRDSPPTTPASSSDSEGGSARKRVHFTTTIPAPDADVPPSSLGPLFSPPSKAADIPPMLDLTAVAKRRLKSPRKRYIPPAVDADGFNVRGVGPMAVQKLEGLTVPRPFALGTTRASPVGSVEPAAVVKESQTKAPLVTTARPSSASGSNERSGLMGPPPTRASSSSAPPTKTISRLPSSRSSRSGLSTLAQAESTQSTARIPPSSSSSSIAQHRNAAQPVRSACSAPSQTSAPFPIAPSLPCSSSSRSLSVASIPGTSVPARSKASYPTSLGSRPPPSLLRPHAPGATARKTSVPSAPSSKVSTSPRSVSDPGAAPKLKGPAPAAAAGKGLSTETKTAMAGLADSLARMQMKKAEAAASACASASASAAASESRRMSTSSTLPNLAQAARPVQTGLVSRTGGATLSAKSSSSNAKVGSTSFGGYSRGFGGSTSGPFSSSIPKSTSTSRLSGVAAPPASFSGKGLPASASHPPIHPTGRSSSSSAFDPANVSLTSSKSTSSLATLVGGNSPQSDALKGVVAYVDVRTAEGDEAGGMFVEILRGLGARVVSRPSESLTHIIYKSGKQSTLAHYRKTLVDVDVESEDTDETLELSAEIEAAARAAGLVAGPGRGWGDKGRPKQASDIRLVGIGWVIRCKEEKKKVPERDYELNLDEQSGSHKRRKSMEPKALRNSLDLSLMQPPPVQQSVESVRRRSLLFAPRVGSPLKKAYATQVSQDDDDDDHHEADARSDSSLMLA